MLMLFNPVERVFDGIQKRRPIGAFFIVCVYLESSSTTCNAADTSACQTDA
jgi:hypothetical protein